MAEKVETTHAGEFIVSEAPGSLSREKVTVLSGENLVAAAVVGKVTKGTASATADAGNTGDGTMGAITVGTDSKPGVYRLRIIIAAVNAGQFILEDPDGIDIGPGDVASAFSAGGLSFTLADGAADFIVGDRFDITVAAGNGKVVEHDPVGTDGREVAAGILFDAVDATAADKSGAIVVRHAEVNLSELVFKAAMIQGDKDKAVADLAVNFVIAR